MPSRKKSESLGEKLKKLREREGLSLEDLGLQLKLKSSYLARIENDEVLPPVAQILTLARALSVEPSAFMEGEPAKASPAKRAKALSTRTEDYAYETLSEGSKDLRLMAFRVTIDPGSDHEGVRYRHEGEEFIYVLAGKLKIKIGRKTSQLGPGQSVHFDSGKRHQLSNPGKETTILLVVIHPK